MTELREPGPLQPRRGRLTLLFVLLVAVGLAGGTVWSEVRPPPAGPMRGLPAPEVAVTLLDGDQFLLSDHLARFRQPVIINFWASWCEPCRSEVPQLGRFASARSDVTVLGVAIEDTADGVTEFLTETPAPYPMAVDTGRRIADAYQVTGIPATIVIGPDGIVRHHLLGEVDYSTLQRLVD